MSIWYMVCWLGRSLVGLLVFRSRYSPLVHAVCIHSLLTFLFLAASGLSHVIVIVIMLSWLDHVCTMSALISSSSGGSGVQHRCGLPTNMAGARGFCLFHFGTGVFGQQKGFSIIFHSFCLESGFIMGKRNGSRQTSKEFLEFDLNRISLVLVLGLVTCYDGFPVFIVG
ncbi:hypothetical protein BDW71DRAFT_38581 [Aspergillus fruticulosus]